MIPQIKYEQGDTLYNPDYKGLFGHDKYYVEWVRDNRICLIPTELKNAIKLEFPIADVLGSGYIPKNERKVGIMRKSAVSMVRLDKFSSEELRELKEEIKNEERRRYEERKRRDE